MTSLPNSMQIWRRLVRKIRRFARTEDHAHDLLQGAILRLAQRSSDEHIINVESYLVRSAANIAVDERRRDAVKVENAYLLGSFVLCDPRPLQDEIIMAREQLAMVARVLERLPPRTRQTFLMHRLDGMKYREISVELGISVSAVEKHVAKAMRALISNGEAF
jgi:RNA polymerase sigma-70 factor (ECF subfamily)